MRRTSGWWRYGVICGATILGNEDIRCGKVATGPCRPGDQHKAFIGFEGIYRWTGEGDDLTLQRPRTGGPWTPEEILARK